jgi:hypothetical protein
MQNMFYGASAFNQDLSSWNIKSIAGVNLQNFLYNTNLSTFNYNTLLSVWSKNAEVKSSIRSFNVSPAQYGGCPALVSNAAAGIDGKAVLTGSIASGGKYWDITDGGAAP